MAQAHHRFERGSRSPPIGGAVDAKASAARSPAPPAPALKGARRLKAERRRRAARQDAPPQSEAPGPTAAETAHSGLQGVLAGLLLVAATSGLSACDKPKDAANSATTAVEGLAIPPDLASACIFSAAPAGYPSIFGASLANLVQAVTKPGATLAWEKSATGYTNGP